MYTCTFIYVYMCVFNFIKKLFIDSFMWLFMADSYVYSVVFCVFHVFMSLFIFLWDWSTLITFEVNRMVVSFPWSHWWQKSLDDPWPGENHSKERLVHQRLCVEAQLFEDKDSSFSWKNEIARGYTPSAIYRWSWRVGGWVSELWRCVRGFRGFLTVLCFKHFWFTYLFFLGKPVFFMLLPWRNPRFFMVHHHHRGPWRDRAFGGEIHRPRGLGVDQN